MKTAFRAVVDDSDSRGQKLQEARARWERTRSFSRISIGLDEWPAQTLSLLGELTNRFTALCARVKGDTFKAAWIIDGLQALLDEVDAPWGKPIGLMETSSGSFQPLFMVSPMDFGIRDLDIKYAHLVGLARRFGLTSIPLPTDPGGVDLGSLSRILEVGLNTSFAVWHEENRFSCISIGHTGRLVHHSGNEYLGAVCRCVFSKESRELPTGNW